MQVDGEEIALNTSTMKTGAPLKLGTLNCFAVSAVNSIGIGQASHSCVESK